MMRFPRRMRTTAGFSVVALLAGLLVFVVSTGTSDAATPITLNSSNVRLVAKTDSTVTVAARIRHRGYYNVTLLLGQGKAAGGFQLAVKGDLHGKFVNVGKPQTFGSSTELNIGNLYFSRGSIRQFRFTAVGNSKTLPVQAFKGGSIVLHPLVKRTTGTTSTSVKPVTTTTTAKPVTTTTSTSTTVKPATTSTTLAPTANANQIGVIGDSLTYMGSYGSKLISAQLENEGWSANNIKVDGLNSRAITSPSTACPSAATKPSPYTESVISTWRAQGFDPHVWLIALGTNDIYDTYTCWQTAVTTIVNQINSGPAKNYQIYWMGVGFADDSKWIATANELGTGVPAGTKPAVFQADLKIITAADKNVSLCDYDAYLAKHRGDVGFAALWTSDGVHQPTQAAYSSLRAPFYAQCVAASAPK